MLYNTHVFYTKKHMIFLGKKITADPCAFWSGIACCAGRVAELRLSGLSRTRAGARRAAFAVNQHQLRWLTALEVFNALVFPLHGRISSWFGRDLSPSST